MKTHAATGEARQAASETPEAAFVARFRGSFSGILRWPQLDALWARLHADTDGRWYIYTVGEPPPGNAAQAPEMERFLREMRGRLRRAQDGDFCGLVYVDDRDQPAFVKIYDPHHLGVVCGFSDNPPLPGWVLSKLPPVDLPNALPPPANRKRWWRLFT